MNSVRYSESARGCSGEAMLSGESLGDYNATEAAWYCVRTKLRHEHIASANLRRQLGLEVFNPQLRCQRKTLRGIVHVTEPLFPCYLFLRCSLGESFAKIRYVNGISSFLHFGDRIPTVAQSVIDDLRACFDTDEFITCTEVIPCGATVTVASGAFAGMSASVLRVLQAGQRVRILLEVLGRSTSVEVDRDLLVMENYSMADRLPSLAVSSNGLAQSV